jgi:hypothetical protein
MTLTIEKKIRSKQDFVQECNDWCKSFRNETDVIIKYVRKGPTPVCLTETKNGFSVKIGKSAPVGVLAAYRGKDGKVRIGWALCRKSEKFYSKVGQRYALERAIPEDMMLDMSVAGRPVPKTLENPMEEFIERTKRYFKI